MSVHFIKGKGKSGKAKPAEDAFGKWYEQHKDSFNEARRQKYKTDPQYRARVLETAKNAREARKKDNAKPDNYTVNHALAAELLEVTIWTLRNWRSKGYFPAPKHFRDGAWFTDNQLALLGEIQHFMTVNDVKRLSKAQQEELQPIIERIHAQWEL